jgi:ABC transporter substrate binding protein (PQQ-dependent alcohol dehydrogenase system)
MFAGANLGLQDNATTGQFLGQTYAIQEISTPKERLVENLTTLQEVGVSLVILAARSEEILKASETLPEALILNVAATETHLRDSNCRPNVLHVTPSDAMRADAVAQFAVYKKWINWLLVRGSNPADKTLAEAYANAARKFGVTIRETREILDTGGSRRADTGHVAVQRQIPVLVQGTKRHDAVIAADASDVFAPYLPFHLWDPRPVMGSAGLRPLSFNPATESWGGTQFQSRFEKLAGRRVQEQDFDTWVAMRVIGEAVTRTGSNSAKDIRDFVLSPDFELAAFKGQPVTFRDWNGQMRQPIFLYDGRINASVSPQDGFLHPISPLDTLGLDRPESNCHAFGGAKK